MRRVKIWGGLKLGVRRFITSHGEVRLIIGISTIYYPAAMTGKYWEGGLFRFSIRAGSPVMYLRGLKAHDKGDYNL